jgi:hypothetical protein
VMARSRIIRPQESLVLYKSFSTLCVVPAEIFRSLSFKDKEENPITYRTSTKFALIYDVYFIS